MKKPANSLIGLRRLNDEIETILNSLRKVATLPPKAAATFTGIPVDELPDHFTPIVVKEWAARRGEQTITKRRLRYCLFDLSAATERRKLS